MVHNRIEINPEIMFGKPVIKGTRITVEHVLRNLAGGMTGEDIQNDHPHLAPEDIYAATAFAADHIRVHKFHEQGKEVVGAGNIASLKVDLKRR